MIQSTKVEDMPSPLNCTKKSCFPFLAFEIVIGLVLISILANTHCCESFSLDKSIAIRTTKQTGINQSITSRRNKVINNICPTVVLSNSNESTDQQTDMASVSQETRDSLEGRSVLVTGASGGLGEQLALQIAHYCKPKKLILSGRKEGALQKIAEECKSSAGDVVHIVTADLSEKDSVRALGESALQIVADAG